jgi:RNA polymerase sigma-70 factor (ECF subfamily)
LSDRGAIAADGDRRPDSETTQTLLIQVRSGDDDALNRLYARYLPVLTRWARGRIPASIRGLATTDDVVQNTLLGALRGVREFEPRHDGAFFAWLRRILDNKIRDLIRRAQVRPSGSPPGEEIVDRSPSPLERAIGTEKLRAYERALEALPEGQAEAVIMRVEFGMTYAEIAEELESPSANATRMMISRALMRMAEAMDDRE